MKSPLPANREQDAHLTDEHRRPGLLFQLAHIQFHPHHEHEQAHSIWLNNRSAPRQKTGENRCKQVRQYSSRATTAPARCPRPFLRLRRVGVSLPPTCRTRATRTMRINWTKSRVSGLENSPANSRGAKARSSTPATTPGVGTVSSEGAAPRIDVRIASALFEREQNAGSKTTQNQNI